MRGNLGLLVLHNSRGCATTEKEVGKHENQERDKKVDFGSHPAPRGKNRV